jgi:hypothetical protein
MGVLLAGFAKLRAGFAKLWFRRTNCGWRIDRHAVVGTIVLLGSLLFVSRELYLVYLQRRLPGSTEIFFFVATLGSFGVWYVVYPNLGLLGWLWEHPLGKLFYGLVASVTVTVGKIGADQEIRLLTQSNPVLFPSAQQAITVFFIIVMIFAEIGLIMMVPVFWIYLKWMWEILLLPLSVLFHSLRSKFRSEILSMTHALSCMWGVVSIFSLGSFLTDFSRIGGERFSPTERLLLLSSFIPNDLGRAGSDRVCVNLPFDTLVSPFSTRDPTPNQVLMAQPITTGPDRLGHSYTYHVIECSKPTFRQGGFP